MNQSPAKDADQEFLRMMVDHHEGLPVLSDSALKKGTSIREMAEKMKAAQAREIADFEKKIQRGV